MNRPAYMANTRFVSHIVSIVLVAAQTCQYCPLYDFYAHVVLIQTVLLYEEVVLVGMNSPYLLAMSFNALPNWGQYGASD